MAIASKWLINLAFLLLLSQAFADSSSLDITPTESPVFLPQDDKDCEEFFIYMKNASKHEHVDNKTLEADAAIFAQCSGHSLNDLGAYNMCKNPKFAPRNYYLMQLTSKSVNNPDGSFGLYVGLCLPSYCSREFLANETDTVLEFIRSMKIKQLPAFDVSYIDPKDPSYDVETGFWFYFTLLILAIIIILNVMGAYLSPYAKPRAIPDPSFKSSIRSGVNGGINDSIKEDSFVSNDAANPRRNTDLGDLLSLFLRQRPKFAKLLDCFDFHQNVRALFQQQKDSKLDHSLNVLDGLRTIAFFGIVFAHTFLNSTMSKNEFSLSQFTQEKGLLIAMAAFFGVDVFFLLSGFLQGFQLLNKLRRSELTFKTYFDLIRHRWIRLVPTYFIAILLYWKLAVHLGDGPLWYQFVGRAQQCGDSWWKNILFLDNVLNSSSHHYCFNWGWYLACDFQMFLLAPFICWIFSRNKIRGINMLWVLGLLTFIAGFWGASNVNFKYAFPPEPIEGDFWSSFYANTLVRMSSYLLGILLGTQYREFKQGQTDNLFAKIKKNPTFGYMTSLFGFLLTAFIIFYPRTVQTGHPWDDGFNYLWQIIDRPLLALGLFLGVVPTIVGLLGPIKWFLSSYFFLVISKISYCGYLVQLIVILVAIKSQTVFLGFSYKNKSMLTISYVMISLLVGTILHLLVEKPAMNLEATFLSNHKKHHHHSHAKRSFQSSQFSENPSKLIPEEEINGVKKV